jgi:hypothetical protein
MNCLFCRNNSDNSKGVEHIIPESLGNKDHILPRGLVCDSCNQYFSNKIEKPLLEQAYFKNVRHRARIESKKGRVPAEKAIIISSESAKADLFFDPKLGMTIVMIEDEEKAKRIISNPTGSIIVPALTGPDDKNKILSRFLAKVAIEGLLYKLLNIDGWIDEVMSKNELEDIIKYARYNECVEYWPYHQRRIYPEQTKFSHPQFSQEYEILHEFNLLQTKENHFYFVIAIMGIEYAINLGGPGIESYKQWLIENHNISILEDSNERKTTNQS